ncbi:nitrate ABC transporter substrate-binding protein [ANME-1 cluster archaeon AG-394-G21]|nr:nitrate ABC transporter substrate-binding protein [ANME-1 cluster archaeon AG-394-G21]
MKISAIVIAAGILALVTFTTGCVQEQQSDVGMAVEFNDHAACAHVAKENGWYKEEGLNFTAYESYATGIRLASALARGDIQVAYICLSPAILAYSRGVPIKIVAGTHKYGYGLVTQPEITNISDLTGKTLGCVREGAPADLLLNRMIEEYKLKDVKIRRMNPLKQVVALETGRIDAAFLPEHHATVAESKGFHMLIKSQDLWPDMQGSVLVVKTDLIENDPETVRKLVWVTQKATNWLNANPDPTAIILANVLDTEPEVINRSMSRLNYTTDLDAESVQEMIDYMAKLGYIEEGVRADEILDTRFLQGERDVY